MTTDRAQPASGRSWLRLAGWGSAVALILAPLIAMQFTSEVDWGAGDFLFAALMFGIVGLAIELTVRTTRSWAHRGGLFLALATGFLLVWSNLAVGYIGSEDNSYNLLFFGVIGVAVLGSAIAGFRPGTMAWAMVATALAHAAAGIGGFAADPRTGPITLVFTGLWLASAALLRKAAERT